MSLRATLWRASFYKRLSLLSINTPRSSWDRPLEFSILGDEYTCYQTPTKEGGLRGSPTVMIKTTKSCAFVTEGLVPSTHRFLTHFRGGFTEKSMPTAWGFQRLQPLWGVKWACGRPLQLLARQIFLPLKREDPGLGFPVLILTPPPIAFLTQPWLRRPPACQGLFNCQPFSWAPTLYF